MKKYIAFLLIIMGVAFSVQVLAQERYPVFSPSVFIGGKKGKRQPYSITSDSTPIRKSTVYRRMALKYYEGQREPTEAQKVELLKVVDRIRAGRVSEVDLRAFSTTRWHSHVRLIDLLRFFKAYTPDTYVKAVIADEASVLEKNDNTVYLTEIP